MTVPKPPSPGDYQGAASANGVITTPGNAGVTSSSSGDIWGLGNVYGKSMLLGVGENDNPMNSDSYPGAGGPIGPQYSTTQQYMQHVIDLWAAQTEERQKFPNRLTTYEQLQRSLWQAGFYGQTSLDSIHVGQWTSQTQDALVNALGNYEQLSKGGKLPLTFSEFLNQNAVMGQDGGQNSGGSGGSSPAPFSPNLADPTALKELAQSAAEQALGKALPADQLNKFVQQFQAANIAAQRASYNGNASTAPNPTAQADAFVQQNDPKAYQQNQRNQYLDALVNLLGGNRPTAETPTPAVGG